MTAFAPITITIYYNDALTAGTCSNSEYNLFVANTVTYMVWKGWMRVVGPLNKGAIVKAWSGNGWLFASWHVLTFFNKTFQKIGNSRRRHRDIKRFFSSTPVRFRNVKASQPLLSIQHVTYYPIRWSIGILGIYFILNCVFLQ